MDRLWLAEASAALASGHAEQVPTLIERGSTALASSTDAAILLADADVALGRQCLEREEWECSFKHVEHAERRGSAAARTLRTDTIAALRLAVDAAIASADATKDLAPRVTALESAQQRLALLETWTTPEAAGTSAESKRISQRLARDTSALESERAAEAKRAAAEQAKLRRVEEREASRRRAAEERARRAEERANRGLRCCDGSLSPSCMCSGSHQGCCSHHGGVCGCE